MTSANSHGAPKKRRLTTFELVLIAPFFLFALYAVTEQLVLPEGAAPKAVQPPALVQPVAVQEHAPAPASETPSQPVAAAATDVRKSSFVTTGTTVQDRIAPIGTVTFETAAAPEVAVAPAAAPVPAPTEPASVEAAKPVAAPAPAAVQPAPAVAEAKPQTAAPRLEISDATGTESLAKNVAQTLEQSGFSIAKISSMPQTKQRRTVILYRDGFEEEARRLSKRFAVAPALVNNTRSRDSADTSDVRLVLGSAAAREKHLLVEGGTPKS